MQEIKIIEFKKNVVPKCLPEDSRMYQTKDCLVVANKKNDKHHLVISNAERYPTMDEIRAVRNKLLPKDITVIMVIGSEKETVNINEKGYHLWEQ